MAECEICGRTLKTGRKYCYEHRYTNQAEGLSSMKKLERAYYVYRKKTMKLNQIFLFVCISIPFVGMLLSVVLGSIFIFIFGIPLFFIILYAGLKITDNIIYAEIDNHSDEFVEFAQEYGDAVKEERAFRKSIFN